MALHGFTSEHLGYLRIHQRKLFGYAVYWAYWMITLNKHWYGTPWVSRSKTIHMVGLQYLSIRMCWRVSNRSYYLNNKDWDLLWFKWSNVHRIVIILVILLLVVGFSAGGFDGETGWSGLARRAAFNSGGSSLPESDSCRRCRRVGERPQWKKRYPTKTLPGMPLYLKPSRESQFLHVG